MKRMLSIVPKLLLMDSSPSAIVPPVEQQTVDPNTITFIDSELYKAAAKGQIDPFNNYPEPLNLLLTPSKNTILHIHITQQPKGSNISISFTKQILTKCQSLLLQTNNRGETALHMAARHGHDTIVKCLIDSVKANHQDIEAGAGAAKTMLRMENVDKETALHEAVRHNNPSVVQILTEEDPGFTYSGNRLGETPLYLAVERQYSKMALQILDTCTSPAFDGPNGRTALHEAVIRNNSGTATKILEANKTLAKRVDQQGWTPLHHASYFGHLSIVKLLLECDKSAAYIGDKDGVTPLHLAFSSTAKVALSILEHCPDSHELVDHKGRNFLHFAVQTDSTDSLLNRTLQPFNDNDQFVPLLTNIINQKDVDGNTPLHLLATRCLEIPALLKHPLVDRMAVNNGNHTPLDAILNNTDDHNEGVKGSTLGCMKHVGGYRKSWRNPLVLRDRIVGVLDLQEIEKTKASHMIVAALVATVTFTAGFTMPGGYDDKEGTAVLSGNGAFVTFVITDALALLLSTCALFFYYSMDIERSRRRKQWLLGLAALFIMFSIFFMFIAFTTAVFAVLHYTYLRVIICVITGLSALICYSPVKRMFNTG